MKKQFFLILVNSIVLSIFIVMMPFITAQQQNESNYSLMINESNYSTSINESDYYYPLIQDSKNETASHIDKSDKLTVVPTASFAGELIGEKAYEIVPLKDEKIIAV